MTLAELLTLKYPNINFPQECLLQDDGDGQYIAGWFRQEPLPSAEDFRIWAEELEEEYQFTQNKISNKPIYEQLDIIDAKSIRALRANDSERLAELEAEATALREQLLPVG